jgi:hypothetical protein
MVLTIEISRFCAGKWLHNRSLRSHSLAGIYYPEGYKIPCRLSEICLLRAVPAQGMCPS